MGKYKWLSSLLVSAILLAVSISPAVAVTPSDAEIIVFELPGCEKCAGVIGALRKAGTVFSSVDVTTKAGFEQLDRTYEQYSVPKSDRGHFPSGVVAGRFVPFLSPETVASVVASSGAAIPASSGTLGPPSGRVASGMVPLAGFVDGVNPCSLSLMMILITYVQSVGERSRKRQSLALGACFVVGTIIAYYLLGVGVLRVARSLSRWLKAAVFVACIAFLFSIKNSTAEASYVSWLRRLTHSSRISLTLAFVLGFLSSGLEFFCTGQLYLPTLVYLASVPGTVVPRLLFLVYLLAFTIPMWIVLCILVFRRQNILDALGGKWAMRVQNALIWLSIIYFAIQLAKQVRG